MAKLNIDFSQVEASTGAQPALPTGWQNVQIEESEHKPTANNATTGNELIQIKMKVLDGPYMGRNLFKTFNYKNVNEQAQAIGWGEMKALNDALGILQPQDTAEWHNKPFKAHIKYKAARTVPGQNGQPDKDYEEGNDINGFKAYADTSVEVNHTVMKKSGGVMVPHSGIPGGSPVPAVGSIANVMGAVNPALAPAAPAPAAPAPVIAPPPPAPAPAPPAPVAAPVWEFRMTAKANGISKEKFQENPAWTDEMLISQGYAEMVQVTAPAPLAPPAPVAPAPPVAPAAPTSTATTNVQSPVAQAAPAGDVPPWLAGQQ